MGRICPKSFEQLLDVSEEWWILPTTNSRKHCSGLSKRTYFNFINFRDEGFAFQEQLGLNGFEDETNAERGWLTKKKVDPLHFFDSQGNAVLDESAGPYLPTWQTSPVLKYDLVNEDILLNPSESAEARVCYETEAAVLGGFIIAPPGNFSNPNPNTAFFASLRSIWEGKDTEYDGDPMAKLKFPVFDSFNVTARKVVAVMVSVIHWQSYFVNLLPSNAWYTV